MQDASAIGTWKRIKRVCLFPGSLAVFLYLISFYLTKQWPCGKALGLIVWRMNVFLTSCDISQMAQIGPGFRIPHPAGIVIGSAVIGLRATILQNVTIGKKEFGFF